jgi:hypothetical protein
MVLKIKFMRELFDGKNKSRKSIKMKIISILLILFYFSFPNLSKAQNRKFLFPSFDLVRTGPYIGVQRGNYSNLELGYEKQWKDLKLIRPQTSAVYGGINYNINYGVIGADMGAWRKLGVFGITYGVAALFRTDFTFSKIGFTPFLGLKLGKFHIKTGHQFLFPMQQEFGVNEYYISLRFKVWSTKRIKKG